MCYNIKKGKVGNIMHSMNTKSANFHFNSDFSGDIIINDVNGNEVRIESKDLIRFIEESEILKNKKDGE